MATKVPLIPLASGIRLSLWLLLWLAALVDVLMHRHIRSRGWQLQRGLLALLSLMAVKEALQLALAAGGAKNTTLLGSYIVLADACDAWWLALLLLISCGYSITRNTLGEYKSKVIGLPSAYFCLILVVDMFILNDNPPAFYTFTEFRQDEYGGDGGQYNQTNASAAYEDPDMYSDQFDGGEPISVTWLMVTLMAAVASLLCWIMGVLFIFEFVKAETDALEYGIKKAEESRNITNGTGSAAEAGSSAFAGIGDPDAAAATGSGTQGSDLCYDVLTVEDAVSHRDKISLLLRFRISVYGYAVAYACVLLLPILIDDATVPQTTIFVYNLVLWAFTAWLIWIFRLREDNPYLMLSDDGQVGGAGGFNASELDTELGVLQPGDDSLTTQDESMVTRPVARVQVESKVAVAEVASPGSNFTLGDEEGEAWEDMDDEWGGDSPVLRPPTQTAVLADGEQKGSPSSEKKDTALSMPRHKKKSKKAE